MNHFSKSHLLKVFSILIALSSPLFAKDYEKQIFLWDGVPKMETQKRDTILYYCPPNQTKQNSETDSHAGRSLPAVIICPGGSYHHLGIPHEGFASARWFSSQGFAAFVLRYRVAYNCHHYPDQLEDIQMAIVYLREHAEEFNIDKNKVGAIGYSAGGHLVTMAGEFATTHNELSKLGIETKESLRPDFVMPIYPVVSMQDDIGHKWSRKSLLGVSLHDVIVWNLENDRTYIVGKHKQYDVVHTCFVIICTHFFVSIVDACRYEAEVIMSFLHKVFHI